MPDKIGSIDFLDTELADVGCESSYESSVSAQSYQATQLLDEYSPIDYDAMSEVPLALEAYISLHHSIDL